MEETGELYTEDDQRRLTDLPTNVRVIFVHQRPALWQPFVIASDLIHNVQYLDSFENSQQGYPVIEKEYEISIFKFINTDAAITSFLVEAFELAVDQKSRFGYSTLSLLAMKGLALVYRIFKRPEEAKEVLSRALDLSHVTQTLDMEMRYELLYDSGALYLDQGNVNSAEQYFFLIEKDELRPPPDTTSMLNFFLMNLQAI